jgi:hypothetical protein
MVDKSRKFIGLVRLGYFARGMTYLVFAYLALSGGSEARAGAQSVFDWLGEVPLGTPLLWLMTVGLLAYSAFKLLSALANIQHRSSDPGGALKRLGDAASAVAYGFLAFAALQFAIGVRRASGGGQTRHMARSVLSFEIGPLALGCVGIGFAVGAAMQAKEAFGAGFMRDLSASAPGWVAPVGRIGHAARAVVFGVIGYSLVRSAWFDRSGDAKGLGEALLSLRGNEVLFTLVAAGLALFGVFSMVVARYRVLPDFDTEQLKRKLPG